MKKGDRVYTPRFCNVIIQKVFRSYETARKQGYVVSTDYCKDGYTICGKHLGFNCMIFAAIRLEAAK